MWKSEDRVKDNKHPSERAGGKEKSDARTLSTGVPTTLGHTHRNEGTGARTAALRQQTG